MQVVWTRAIEEGLLPFGAQDVGMELVWLFRPVVDHLLTNFIITICPLRSCLGSET